MTSIYPATTPVTAPVNAEGYDLPTGWEFDPTYEVVSGSCVRVLRGRYRIPVGGGLYLADAGADLSGLGTQNPALMAQFYYAMMRAIETARWVVRGYQTAQDSFNVPTPGGGLMSQRWTMAVDSATGRLLTIDDAGGPDNPRSLVLRLDRDGVTGLWELVTTSLQPGDEVRFNGIAARVLRFPNYSAAGLSTVELSKDLGAVGADLVEVWRERPAPWWPMRTWRSRYVEPITTAWVAAGVYLLPKVDASDGAIAWPMAPDGEGNAGTFRVEAKNTAGLRYDVTAAVLSGFPGLGAGARVRFLVVGGVEKTQIDLTGLGGESYRVKYLAECVSQAAPSAAAWRATQTACKHCVRDWSDRLGSSGLDGTAIDAGGGHWFCDQRNKAGVLIAGFSEWCYQSECPWFVLNSPWMPGIGAVAGITVSRSLRYRYPANAPQYPVIERGPGSGNVSLHELAGMPGYTGDGTAGDGVTWLVGSNTDGTGGALGRIEDVPTAEKAADEGDVKRIVYGAFGEDGSGVLGVGGVFSKEDRACGKNLAASKQYEDGSGYFDDEANHPLREMPNMGLSINSQWGGESEKEVQRVRTVPVRVGGLEVGDVGASLEGNSWVWTPAGGLVVTFSEVIR